MAVSHRGAISFGLVHIPVALYTATQDNDISFNQLHSEDSSRIKYKKTCAHCGKEVASTDIVKGFEFEKDRYVIITDEDLEKIKTDKDRALQIVQFTDLSNIRPVYYEKTYHCVPEVGGERAFVLLYEAMRESGKVAIAKTVMGNKETLICIMPSSEGLVVSTMYFADEVKELPKEFARPEVNPAELEIAKQLIAGMDKAFEPETFKNEYQERLRSLIADKIAGKEIQQAKPEADGNVIDLMEALKRSVEQTGGGTPKVKRKRTG